MAKVLQLQDGIPRMVDAPSGDLIYTQAIVNNQTTPLAITDAIIDKDLHKVFTVDYGIVRWHSGSKAIEQGSFAGMYDPILEEWILAGAVYSGNNAGVEFYITTSGQLQYTSTNRSGTITESSMSLSLKLL